MKSTKHQKNSVKPTTAPGIDEQFAGTKVRRQAEVTG